MVFVCAGCDSLRSVFDQPEARGKRGIKNPRKPKRALRAQVYSACGGIRALGVPARLGLARVRNHLATASLEKKLGTDVLTPHGYGAFWNGQKWVKCTPVFNRALCHKLGTSPLEWDAVNDVLFQPLDSGGQRFMEYIVDYGLFTTVPMDFIRDQLWEMYPHAFDGDGNWSLPA